MTIDKQSSEVRRILTHLKGLNACDIDEIIEKVNAKVGTVGRFGKKLLKMFLRKKILPLRILRIILRIICRNLLPMMREKKSRIILIRHWIFL